MVAEFQRGLLRADVTIAVVWLTFAGLSIASAWLRLGAPRRLRLQHTALIGAITVAVLLSASRITASWDASESGRNSFSETEVAALRALKGDLRIVAHFAPEDPRRSDLEHNAFRKLRRALPRTRIDYVSATSTGLFEQTSEKYGEVEYALGGRTITSRVITADGVLESVFSLADSTVPPEPDEEIFRGHPLAAQPRGAAAVYYIAWPLAVGIIAWFAQERRA
jgi:hypothetical protein